MDSPFPRKEVSVDRDSIHRGADAVSTTPTIRASGRRFAFAGFAGGTAHGEGDDIETATRGGFLRLKGEVQAINFRHTTFTSLRRTSNGADDLSAHELRLADICSLTIVVRSMSDYAAVNAEYLRHFASLNPPCRACVELDSLPQGTALVLSGAGAKVCCFTP